MSYKHRSFESLLKGFKGNRPAMSFNFTSIYIYACNHSKKDRESILKASIVVNLLLTNSFKTNILTPSNYLHMSMMSLFLFYSLITLTSLFLSSYNFLIKPRTTSVT